MKPSDIHFRTRNEDLINWLQSQSNQSEQIEEILNKVRLGELVEPQDLDYENKLKAAKLEKILADTENKKLDTEIKKKHLSYMETFDDTPTFQGKKAIKERVLTQNEIGNVEQYITLHTNGTGFQGICDFCKLDITEGTRQRTLQECTRHLIACHRTEILKE